MNILATLFIIFVIVMFGQARHIHSKDFLRNFEYHPEKEMILAEETPYVPLLTKIKKNNLVPINNILFFQTHDPCPNEMKRDILGICREVWTD